MPDWEHLALKHFHETLHKKEKPVTTQDLLADFSERGQLSSTLVNVRAFQEALNSSIESDGQVPYSEEQPP